MLLERGRRRSGGKLAHSGRVVAVIVRCQRGCCYGRPTSDEPNADRLRSLAALDHINRYTLTFGQLADTGAVQRRDMHENILAAAVPDGTREAQTMTTLPLPKHCPHRRARLREDPQVEP